MLNLNGHVVALTPMVYLMGLAAVVFTFLGGLFALRFKDRLHLILGFSAGALVGVAFFDLLPESIELLESYMTIGSVTTLVAIGFASYMILERFLSTDCHAHDESATCENPNHKATVGAGSLAVHSFIDGVAIGLAFQVSAGLGFVVAIAVLVHDFSDGINTVGIVLRGGQSRLTAIKWLSIDAIAPALGILATTFVNITEFGLGVLLAIFCGFFFYIGASDLLPESHHRHPTIWTTIATLIGMGVLFLAIRVSGV